MKGRAANDIIDWRAFSSERFGLLLFLAAAVHGILLLALSFDLPDPPPRQPTLDITLAQFKQEKAPEQADFLAQHNQQGSGDSEERHLPSSPEEAPFSAPEPKPQSAQAVAAPAVPQPQPEAPLPPAPAHQLPTPPAPAAPAHKEVLSTIAKSTPQARPEPPPLPTARPQPRQGHSTSLLAQSLEIASLQAQLDREREQFAKRPRVRRLSAASTLSHEDATYLDNWRRRIETVGNLNYPEQARRDQIYGVLRLLVEIMPDGSVNQIRILESSGHAILDDAAGADRPAGGSLPAFPRGDAQTHRSSGNHPHLEV